MAYVIHPLYLAFYLLVCFNFYSSAVMTLIILSPPGYCRCYHHMFWFYNKIGETEISVPFKAFVEGSVLPVLSPITLSPSTSTVLNKFCLVFTIIITANMNRVLRLDTMNGE